MTYLSGSRFRETPFSKFLEILNDNFWEISKNNSRKENRLSVITIILAMLNVLTSYGNYTKTGKYVKTETKAFVLLISEKLQHYSK